MRCNIVSVVDVEKIINGTPVKMLHNRYNDMKANYTEESAQEYYNVYSNQSLSFLFENSRMIFSEPYFGYQYYKEAVENVAICDFTVLESEYEKVLNFLEENGDNMSEDQRGLYQSLESSIATTLKHTKNTRMIANYIKENVSEDFEFDLSNAMFDYVRMDEKDTTEILKIMESVKDYPIVSMTYAPYIGRVVESSLEMKNLSSAFIEKCETQETIEMIKHDMADDEWSSFIEKTAVANKLSCDDIYKESVSEIDDRNVRIVYEAYMNNSVYDVLTEMSTETVNYFVSHSNPESLVNSLFEDMRETAIYEEEYKELKDHNDRLNAIALEKTLDLLVSDYQTADDVSKPIEGYSFFKTRETYESAYECLFNIYKESPFYESEDVDDDDIDSLDKEVNDEHYGSEQTGKKPKAPQPKNVANKVQFKAMDKEAQQRKKMSVTAQKGQEIKNAANAVLQLPKNVIQSIKEQIHKADEKDDERRKNYMTEPGFRKKAIRNMKLAVLYGSAANVKLSLIPIVAMSRHYSKKKDIRMRNELAREINTEIKVCEEKIADANANNDNSEKYRLIRIKDQLNAELVRVKTNSKFV